MKCLLDEVFGKKILRVWVNENQTRFFIEVVSGNGEQQFGRFPRAFNTTAPYPLKPGYWENASKMLKHQGAPDKLRKEVRSFLEKPPQPQNQ